MMMQEACLAGFFAGDEARSWIASMKGRMAIKDLANCCADEEARSLLAYRQEGECVGRSS